MKKIIYLFILSLVMPFAVFAMDNSEVFDIGDSVTVSFDGGTTRLGFHVIKNSAAGETTATLFFDGVIATHDADGNIKEAQVVYQLPDSTGTASQFDGSYAQKVLNEAVTEAKWIINGSARLLEENDLVNLGIAKDNDIIKYVENFIILVGNQHDIETVKIIPIETAYFNERTDEEINEYKKVRYGNWD